MLKKLIGKSPDYVGKIKDNLEGHHFATKEVCFNITIQYDKTQRSVKFVYRLVHDNTMCNVFVLS